MATTETDPDLRDETAETAQGAGRTTESRLSGIERAVERLGDRTKSAQQAWMIFAVLALLIAAANLVAVALKLDGRTSTTTVTTTTPAPAATPPATAAAPAAPAAIHSVAVGLKEFTITPSSSTAAAGRVTFKVKNAGTIPHEFVVLRTPKPAGSLLQGALANESGNVGESGDLAVGASKTLTLNLKAGHYALICNLPGHYKAGQHTDFTVK